MAETLRTTKSSNESQKPNNEKIEQYKILTYFLSIYIKPKIDILKKEGITQSFYNELVLNYKNLTGLKLDRIELYKILYIMGKDKILFLTGLKSENELFNLKITFNNKNTTFRKYFFLDIGGYPTQERIIELAIMSNKNQNTNNINMFASK